MFQKSRLKEENIMDYLFADKEKTKTMVYGTYKKLKSFLYYDKTLLFAKRSLAILESDRTKFIQTLDEIVDNLNKENIDYFERLIENIDYRVLPKKFKTLKPETDIISATVDHECNVNKVNFFIDMPIELYIIDFLWTLLIGKIINERIDIFLFSYATKFKDSLFNFDDKDIFSGTDFESNRSFVPYYGQYTSWRNQAFRKIEEIHPFSDSMLICLDLKSFYYSVDFDFKKLSEFLDDDPRLEMFSFLTDVIEKIYLKYTNKIIKVKKGVRVKEDNCIFPIGTTSALVLREIYLYAFDGNIVNSLSPEYYGRYVDDILIVVKMEENIELQREKVIEQLFVKTGLVIKSGGFDLKFKDYTNIKIQKDKVNCFHFPKNQKTILLDIYAEAINMNSSEANLLPDVDTLSSSFTQVAYNIQNFELSNKIRELGFLRNNNYNATRFINALLKQIKNTTIEKSIMNKYFDQIEEFYRGSQSVEYSNSWRALFELYLICEEKSRARKVYSRIRDEIKKLSFVVLDSDEILEKEKPKILRHLIKDTLEKLEISAALTTALNYGFSKSKTVRDLAVHFRNSNMLNHAMVSYPLLNYSTVENVSLTEKNISKLYEASPKAFELDKFKLQWTPRYINAIELYIADFIYSLRWKGHGLDLVKIHEKFVSYNNLGDYAKDNFSLDLVRKDKVEHVNMYAPRKTQTNPKIALVNTNISMDDAFCAITNPAKCLGWNAKKRLFKILNIAKEEKVDILVFPEFYFPLPWLLDIAIFALKNKITIITGMQYITIAGRAYNTVCNFVPSVSKSGFVNGFMLFREKNFYAPEEIIELGKLKHSCFDQDKPLYFTVNNGRYEYSTILCYEFTDITSRASMKSIVELLFVPQLNKDTNYFSAIVESTARDLHCFVIQANTSAYGDSRITAPYKTQNKNILQIKGGETDVVMIATLDVEELYTKRSKYRREILSLAKKCMHCKNTSSKNRYSKKCKNCTSAKGKVKGTPPNF